jgi:hypothetical protein
MPERTTPEQKDEDHHGIYCSYDPGWNNGKVVVCQYEGNAIWRVVDERL